MMLFIDVRGGTPPPAGPRFDPEKQPPRAPQPAPEAFSRHKRRGFWWWVGRLSLPLVLGMILGAALAEFWIRNMYSGPPIAAYSLFILISMIWCAVVQWICWVALAARSSFAELSDHW